mmetsp:Transcript_44861/g.112804  ORF Transcript_44861/g.112804 Transcript_44861/m.112804 type:complete len:244 (-) Transcript_44861:434-1165(-)
MDCGIGMGVVDIGIDFDAVGDVEATPYCGTACAVPRLTRWPPARSPSPISGGIIRGAASVGNGCCHNASCRSTAQARDACEGHHGRADGRKDETTCGCCSIAVGSTAEDADAGSVAASFFIAIEPTASSDGTSGTASGTPTEPAARTQKSDEEDAEGSLSVTGEGGQHVDALAVEVSERWRACPAAALPLRASKDARMLWQSWRRSRFRRCFSCAGQTWQKRQSALEVQPFVWKKAQGLHRPA